MALSRVKKREREMGESSELEVPVVEWIKQHRRQQVQTSVQLGPTRWISGVRLRSPFYHTLRTLFSSFYFSFFPFLPFLSFHFSFSTPFFGKSGFGILFALPWGDFVVLCFGGEDEDSFDRPRSKIVWGCVSKGAFIVGALILISGAKQIWVSRCRSRAELPYYSTRHVRQWWFGNNVQN